MSINKDPFVFSNRKNGLPHTFLGLVRAGGSQAIKIGELCTWNEQTGYFKPVDAVADHRYPLAISREEQKAAVGRTAELNAERYMEFYSLHPEDVFEFEIAAAAAVAVGDPYTLTLSDSQKLTAAAGAFAVAFAVTDDHYPQEINVTIRSISYARVAFNPVASYWGYRFSKGLVARSGGRRVITVSTTEELAENDMYNTLILLSGTTTVTLPAVKPGMDIIVLNADANANKVDLNASDQFRLDGAQKVAGTYIGATGIGKWVRIITEGANAFIVIAKVGEWAGE